MKYLITGGAGFIGSHLAEKLLALGHEVTSLDDLSTGRKENLKNLEGASGFNLVQGNMLDETLMDSLMSKVDCIIVTGKQSAIS